jgi:hypothetical protein
VIGSRRSRRGCEQAVCLWSACRSTIADGQLAGAGVCRSSRSAARFAVVAVLGCAAECRHHRGRRDPRPAPPPRDRALDHWRQLPHARPPRRDRLAPPGDHRWGNSRDHTWGIRVILDTRPRVGRRPLPARSDAGVGSDKPRRRSAPSSVDWQAQPRGADQPRASSQGRSSSSASGAGPGSWGASSWAMPSSSRVR